MKYFSKLLLGKEQAARLRLYDGYRWHQKIWTVFPSHPDQSRDFLFRVDDDRYRFKVLILSARKPLIPEWGTFQTTTLSPAYFSFSRYHFSLKANPTTKRVIRNEKGERKKNGRRTGLYAYSDLEDWIKKKSETAGFQILDLSISPPIHNLFKKKESKGCHIASEFKGILEVSDRDRFIEASQKGIGPARAFGLGMLLVQPLG